MHSATRLTVTRWPATGRYQDGRASFTASATARVTRTRTPPWLSKMVLWRRRERCCHTDQECAMFDQPPSLPMRAAIASLLGGLFGVALILATHTAQAEAQTQTLESGHGGTGRPGRRNRQRPRATGRHRPALAAWRRAQPRRRHTGLARAAHERQWRQRGRSWPALASDAGARTAQRRREPAQQRADQPWGPGAVLGRARPPPAGGLSAGQAPQTSGTASRTVKPRGPRRRATRDAPAAPTSHPPPAARCRPA